MVEQRNRGREGGNITYVVSYTCIYLSLCVDGCVVSVCNSASVPLFAIIMNHYTLAISQIISHNHIGIQSLSLSLAIHVVGRGREELVVPRIIEGDEPAG